MRDLGEDEGGKVEDDQDDRHNSAHDLFLDEADVGRREDQESGHEQAGHGEQQRGGVDTGGTRAEPLLLVAETADHESDSEHEQQVAEDRSDQ